MAKQPVRCPLIISKGNAEESIDYCEETENFYGMKICELVAGNRCETWEAIQREEDWGHGRDKY